MSVFDQCFAIVVGSEGGYVNDPSDPGGATKYGISQRAYPNLDIAALTLDDAKAIYRRDYWNRIKGDELAPNVALVVFDSAVNSGVGAAVFWLQQAAGAKADGIFGPKTLAAVKAAQPEELVPALMAIRILADSCLGGWQKYGKGWVTRVCRLPFQAQTIRA